MAFSELRAKSDSAQATHAAIILCHLRIVRVMLRACHTMTAPVVTGTARGRDWGLGRREGVSERGRESDDGKVKCHFAISFD